MTQNKKNYESKIICGQCKNILDQSTILGHLSSSVAIFATNIVLPYLVQSYLKRGLAEGFFANIANNQKIICSSCGECDKWTIFDTEINRIKKQK